MYLTAYSPKAALGEDDSVINANLYVFVNSEGEAEAGVRSMNTTVYEGSSYSNNNIVFMGAAWNDYAEFRD
jgi:hypothetical protein